MRLTLAASLALGILVPVVPAAEQSASPPEQTSRSEVTFTKDVAPILQDNCQVCHRPGTFAPMSLVTYEQVRPWAKGIKAKTMAREMPPWFIDKNIGVQEFSHDRSLTDREIATLAAWADGGAVKGNPADMPAPRQFLNDKEWQFGQYGEPDLVLTLPADYLLPASGPDHWPVFIVDPKLIEDRYIAGVQIIPTKGFSELHHVQTRLIAPPKKEEAADQPDEEMMGAFLNEYAIGKGADFFPDSAGRLIKSGTKVSIELHMHPDDDDAKATPVNIALGMKFHPRGYKPKHVALSEKVPYANIDIRPGDKNARVDGYFHLTQPARVLSWQPHMHNRGTYACMEALIPPAPGAAGIRSSVEMLSCARFVFNWHLNYVYAPESAPLLPAGTVLHTMQWHDNSAANKQNTDPDAQITHGQRTVDEMAGAWISFHYMSEDEYKEELKSRKARNYYVRTSPIDE